MYDVLKQLVASTPIKTVELVDPKGLPNPLDWIAFVIGCGGFIFAMWQVLKTNGAAKRAAEALDYTRKSLIRTQVITVMTDLKGILGSIDTAYLAENKEALLNELSRFTFRALETSDLLEHVDEETAEIQAVLFRLSNNVSMERSALFLSDDLKSESLIEAITELRVVVPQVHSLGVSMAYTPMSPITEKKSRRKEKPETIEATKRTTQEEEA